MVKKFKLAFVSTHPPGMGTLNEYGFYLLKHFRKKEEINEIVLITDKLEKGKNYHFDPDEGCKVTVKEAWKFNSLNSIFSILKAVKESKPDIVFFNIQFLSFGDKKIAAALGLMIPFLLRLSGYPSVVLMHNILEEVDLQKAEISSNPLMNKIFNIIGTTLTSIVLKSNLFVVTIAKYVNTLEKKYKAKNIALVPHGSFEIPPEPDYQLPVGAKKIMTFGKFGTYKKVEVLIEAVELIRNRNKNLDLEIVIAGTDSPNKVGYLDSVKEKYKQVKNIVFTGYVPEEDVERIFSESTVVVFPYTSTTGSSGVLHQAGSYGKAVILPDLGDLGELLKEEGYGGELFEADDAESLAKAIEKVASDDAYRERISQKNYYAAVSLPMADIADWYILHFQHILSGGTY